MTMYRLNATTAASIAWALPTVFVVLLIETSRYTGVFVPVPFFAIIICVMFAGSRGGRQAGLLAAITASIFVVLSYFQQFGPTTLTGGVSQAAIGSALFLLVGNHLGQLRDQRDASVRDLRAALDRETTERARQAGKVADRETRLDAATRIAGIGHFSFDAGSGNCTYCSKQHAANLGMTQEEFRTITTGPEPQLSHIHPEDRAMILDAIHGLNSGEPQTFEYRALLSNGEVRNIRQIEEPKFDKAGKVIEHFGTSLDLTDLRHAEARVRQSQRIEAIGTLTGGVAHDFNNLLAIILGNLELTLDTKLNDYQTELLHAATKATMRGAGLTKNLLSFARRAHLEPTRVNLNQTIQDTMTWGGRVLPETIKIENSLMAGLWDVELDVTSAETALINLLLNARDAMPEGGKITIETANMRIGEEYLSERDEEIEPGRYVMLAISDTGHGIPADKLERVFEPFYTDKPVGEGSGLGLSMVQGFIKQSGGAIRIYSEVGVGTTFKLYFKVAVQQEYKPETERPKLVHPSSEHIEILVAEDEEEVMNILKRVLENEGYAVTTASSGDEALEVFNFSGSFDLLLTDIVMPGTLQGPALAKAIRLIDPDLPCIFMSGYASEATVHGNGLRPSDIRLMKPASRDDLLKAVSKALGKI